MKKSNVAFLLCQSKAHVISSKLFLTLSIQIVLSLNCEQYFQFFNFARMLGMWEESYKDLTTAEKLDYDEDIHEMLKQVKPNVSRTSL